MDDKNVRKVRVMIGFPHIGMVESKFMLSVLGIYQAMIFNPMVGDDIEIEFATVVGCQGSMLPKQRNELVKNAKLWNATHLLFIDTDMEFEKDLVHRLLAAKKSVIACNASTKETHPNPTARKYDPGDPAGLPVFSTLKCPEVEPVWRIGTGIMLIDLEAIEKIPLPWFLMTHDPKTGEHEGEDWYFCGLLSRYKIPIHIHHHASMEIGHVGKYTYTLQQVNRHREYLKNKEIQNG